MGASVRSASFFGEISKYFSLRSYLILKKKKKKKSGFSLGPDLESSSDEVGYNNYLFHSETF